MDPFVRYKSILDEYFGYPIYNNQEFWKKSEEKDFWKEIRERKVPKIHYDNPILVQLKNQWNETHRKYHNQEHLEKVLNELEKSKNKVLPIHWDALVLAAFFHDAICFTLKKDNEEQSANWFLRAFRGKDAFMAQKIEQMILCTKSRKRPTDPLLKIFWDADNITFLKGDFDTLEKDELKIRQEYNHIPRETYLKGRITFLKSCLGTMGKKADEVINKLIEKLKKE
jgi:predicted metal-dependent HD superfamily phosphohydrolase